MTDATLSEVQETLSDYADFWNGDFSKSDAIADEAIIYDTILSGGEVTGQDAIEEYMRGLHAQNPNAHVTVGDTLIDDGIAMYEWTMTGTGQGELNGMSKTLIEDGRVVEDRIYHE